jgi:O-antigen ligase
MATGIGDTIRRIWPPEDAGAGWSRPEDLIAVIVTCGFLFNVQQGSDTNAVLRNDPLVFKGIRVLTILLGGSLALWTLMKRRVPYTLYLSGATDSQMPALAPGTPNPILPLALYFCSCLLSVPFSAYPLLSLFKACEIGLLVFVCIIGITSTSGGPWDFFHLNIKIVLLYNAVIWVEAVLFPGVAWIPMRGSTPLFGYALSGVFPVVNGNTVGLFGAVLFLAYLPRLCEPPILRPRVLAPAALGLASTVFSYSRTSLLGLLVAALVSLFLLRQYALVWAVILCLALVGTSGKARTLAVEHLARGQEDRSLDTFTSHRLTMWDHILSDYHVSIVGRGYAAGFRYDDELEVGHAHNSLVDLYFNVGLLGVATWLFLIGTVCRDLWQLVRFRVVGDYPLISIAGVMVFLMVKALASTVLVHLDASMLILAGIIIYVVRQRAVVAERLLVGDETDISLFY